MHELFSLMCVFVDRSRSVLLTEVFLWRRDSETLDEYIQKRFKCSPLLLPTLYGLRLAEDFETGTWFGHFCHSMPNDSSIWQRINFIATSASFTSFCSSVNRSVLTQLTPPSSRLRYRLRLRRLPLAAWALQATPRCSGLCVCAYVSAAHDR